MRAEMTVFADQNKISNQTINPLNTSLMKKLYLLICSVFTIAVSGQNYDYTLYHPSNSQIASANISDIKVDGSGNLWLATGNALTMYNGNTFTNYTSENTGVELGGLQKSPSMGSTANG
jgi:ligand-binding sensor domain-containing protein